MSEWINNKRGNTPKQNLFIKNCAFIFRCLNFNHLQSILNLMQYTYWDFFPTVQNSFWTHQFWCLLVHLPFFVSPLPHQQNVSVWGLFSMQRNNNKKVSQSEIQRIRRVGMGDLCLLWSKTAEHSARYEQVRL